MADNVSVCHAGAEAGGLPVCCQGFFPGPAGLFCSVLCEWLGTYAQKSLEHHRVSTKSTANRDLCAIILCLLISANNHSRDGTLAEGSRDLLTDLEAVVEHLACGDSAGFRRCHTNTLAEQCAREEREGKPWWTEAAAVCDDPRSTFPVRAPWSKSGLAR